jgi:hypothetical protein
MKCLIFEVLTIFFELTISKQNFGNRKRCLEIFITKDVTWDSTVKVHLLSYKQYLKKSQSCSINDALMRTSKSISSHKNWDLELLCSAPGQFLSSFNNIVYACPLTFLGHIRLVWNILKESNTLAYFAVPFVKKKNVL